MTVADMIDKEIAKEEAIRETLPSDQKENAEQGNKEVGCYKNEVIIPKETKPSTEKIEEITKQESDRLKRRYMSQFDFGIDWLNGYTGLLKKSLPSTYPQIELKAIQNLAFLLSHGGLRVGGFYMLDLSDSGVGKGINFSTQNKLLFDPIRRSDREARQEQKDRIRQMIEDKEISKADADKKYKLIGSIHEKNTSLEGLCQCFETTKTQMLEMEELGNILKMDKNAIIDFIVSAHGKDRIKTPSQKINAHAEPYIEQANFFFYADTNLAYLSSKQLMHHLEGGFFNRCIMVYCADELDYKDTQIIPIPAHKENEYMELSSEIYEFAKEFSGHEINRNYLAANDFLINFVKRVRAAEQESNRLYKQSNSTVYKVMSLANRRTTYNLTSIIITLHYLQEFTKYRACKKSNEEYKFEYLVSDETVKKGIEFLRGYLDFSPLIDKITNVSVSDKIDLKDKIISWVTKQQLPVAFRDIQMNVSGKPTKQQIINLCSDVFKIDGNKITSIL
jgi:hypothetical protein